MHKPVGFALLSICVTTVIARNDTILHGWHSEAHERGTWSIVWGCLATIYFCTWSVLHLDVPPPDLGEWKRFFVKVGSTLFAAVAPEYLLGRAFLRDYYSYKLKRMLIERFLKTQQVGEETSGQKLEPWTLTHTRFVLAGGFVKEDGNKWIWSEDHVDIPSMISEGHQTRRKN